MSDLQNGEEDAFVKIYDAFWQKTYTIAYQRVRSKAIAEELTQNLFLKLWENRGHLIVSDLENYLFIAIKNSVIDHIKSGIRFNKYTEHYQAFVNRKFDSLSEDIKFNDLQEAINKGLAYLPEKTQIVFKLNRFENWPLEKISSHLNLSEKTVGYHLTKSLKFIRCYLKEFMLVVLLFTQ